MYSFKLILRNALRHKLRTGLTMLGIVIAVLAFGLLRTVVDAWYAGAEAASSTRLITRNAISLIFPLPLTYAERVRKVPGVKAISYANWFGGIYQEPKNFFPQFAVDAHTYFDLYPEFMVEPAQLKEFKRDRKGCIVGRKLANQYGWKVGDSIPIKGTIFPGTWEFVVRGIYKGKEPSTDEVQFFFHWDYLNETMKATAPRRANQIGIMFARIADPGLAAQVSQEIDRTFRNSLAETLTETEKAFQLGFVSMTEGIVVMIRIVSFLVIAIIMAVMANTMAMSARERLAEYATLKAIGFGPAFVRRLILGESLVIALAGGGVGCLLTWPAAKAFASSVGTLFPVFNVSTETVALQIAAALLVGVVAAAVPSVRASRVRIIDGLRAVG
jgi:putative ABC transport system permease protein